MCRPITVEVSPANFENSHFLALLAEASASLDVVALADITDSSGFKLIGKDQDVTAAMQLRLAQRALARPLEASLGVRHGVTPYDLEREAARLCQGSVFLAAFVGHDFAQLRRLYRLVPLHPFVTLVLSVQRVTRPRLFSHAVLGSVVAGTLALSEARPVVNPELALLAGLLHDCGELYGNPELADRIAGASRDQWQAIAVHAQVGCRIINQFTDCPESIAQAVYEHHERSDGSGYPRGLHAKQLSQLGRLLGVTETVCGVINAPDNHGARAKLAVSFVAGEYDPQLVRRLVASITGTFAAEVVLTPEFDASRALNQARTMNRCLSAAHEAITRLATARFEEPELARVVESARQRIERLMSSWEATGIGEYFSSDASGLVRPEDDQQSYFDLDVVTREITWRMRSLSRQIVLALHPLQLAGYGGLEPMIAALEVGS